MWTWCRSVCEAAGNGVHGASGKPSATAASNAAVQRGNAALIVPALARCAPTLCLGHQGKVGVPSGTVVRQGWENGACGCGQRPQRANRVTFYRFRACRCQRSLPVTTRSAGAAVSEQGLSGSGEAWGLTVPLRHCPAREKPRRAEEKSRGEEPRTGGEARALLVPRHCLASTSKSCAVTQDAGVSGDT